MVIITYIYQDTPGTEQMIKSFERFGYEVAIIRTDQHRGNGTALRLMYECYKRAATGHLSFMYADAADSFCQRKQKAAYDILIWQTEKACYPHTWVAQHYPNVKSKYAGSPWCFLNNGGYCGSTKLVVEFFEKYGLNQLPPEANGQHEVMTAYIQAIEDGFPIQLDDGCELFQSMAFSPEMQDFHIRKMEQTGTKLLVNTVTNQIPAVLHFNGLTDMSILKELK